MISHGCEYPSLSDYSNRSNFGHQEQRRTLGPNDLAPNARRSLVTSSATEPCHKTLLPAPGNSKYSEHHSNGSSVLGQLRGNVRQQTNLQPIRHTKSIALSWPLILTGLYLTITDNSSLNHNSIESGVEISATRQPKHSKQWLSPSSKKYVQPNPSIHPSIHPFNHPFNLQQPLTTNSSLIFPDPNKHTESLRPPPPNPPRPSQLLRRPSTRPPNLAPSHRRSVEAESLCTGSSEFDPPPPGSCNESWIRFVPNQVQVHVHVATDSRFTALPPLHSRQRIHRRFLWGLGEGSKRAEPDE
jgi:hypothetical protein